MMEQENRKGRLTVTFAFVCRRIYEDCVLKQNSSTNFSFTCSLKSIHIFMNICKHRQVKFWRVWGVFFGFGINDRPINWPFLSSYSCGWPTFQKWCRQTQREMHCPAHRLASLWWKGTVDHSRVSPRGRVEGAMNRFRVNAKTPKRGTHSWLWDWDPRTVL